MKKIVGFGDSWMWGDELIDPALASLPNAHPSLYENTPYREQNCFLGQLGEYLGVPTENFGWPGASLLSTMWCYLWWLEHGTDHENSIVIVTLTESSRTSWYNPRHKVYSNDPPWNRFVHSSWVHSGSVGGDWSDLNRLQTALTDCLQLSRMNYQQAVYFFQGQKHRHPLYMIPVSQPPCRINIPEIVIADTAKIWLEKESRRSGNSVFKSGGHPNELGHKILRDLLIKHINHVTL